MKRKLENILKMLMLSIFSLITIYCFYEKNTKVTLKNSVESCFVLFGGLWGSHSGCFEKHANNSLYHFCMPARVRVLYTDDLIYILLQRCECTIVLSHFTAEITEAQRGCLTCPRSYSLEVLEVEIWGQTVWPGTQS